MSELKGFNYFLNKNRNFTDKNVYHDYGFIYEILLAPYEQKVVNFMEIGIYSGGSTKTFESFFHPESKIVAIDNDISNIKLGFNPNTKIIQANAFEPEFVKNVIQEHGLFDIILDDSLHSYESHEFILNNYISALKPFGLLIMEDVTYDEDRLKRLCKEYKCFYIDNRYQLNYERSTNQRDYDASFVVVKRNCPN